jgi:ABC-type phosphate/phosphonate transport system ATPase subunit
MSATDKRMHYFAMLTRDEQADAIHRLSRSGMSDHAIASATQLSVEMVRKILGEVAAT